VVAQLTEVVLDVAKGDLAPPGVEHIEGDHPDGLDHAHGMDCRPPMAEVVEITFVPTASVKRTSRDTRCAGIGDLHLQPKYPVAQL
jgi:hypothetical protein